MKKPFEAQGFRPEPDPQGNLALGYGCVSVQRRDNWAAVVRGHSRYLWLPNTIFLPISTAVIWHMAIMQILGKPDEMVTFTTSGWQENGFDWNRIPG